MRRVLVTALAVLLLAGCDGSSGDPDPGPSAVPTDRDGTSGTSTESPVGQDEAVACPDEPLGSDPDPDLPDQVPEGATSVRLCDGGADRVTPPMDALTTDVAAVVSAVNEQRLVAWRRCLDRQLSTYELVFGYPDGSSFVVSGRFTGCAELLVGSGRRADAGPPLRTFVRLLAAQRPEAAPGGQAAVEPDSLDCAQPREDWTFPLGDPTGLTVAVLCVGLPQRPGQARRAVIPTADLKTLVASMETDTSSSAGSLGCSQLRVEEHWIVGANAWGDPITVSRGCYGLTVEPPDVEWSPRGDARRTLRELIAEAR
jgi:hypothetical protein